MRTQRALVLVSVGLLGGAFALGMTGLPGVALAAGTQWAVEHGWVELTGPLGDIVRHAIG